MKYKVRNRSGKSEKSGNVGRYKVRGIAKKVEEKKEEKIEKVEKVEKKVVDYPWNAHQSINGKMVAIPRPELDRNNGNPKVGVFPQTGIAPVYSYKILDPNNHDKILELDESQLGAVNLVLSGATCCIVGAAGTGKSTITQAFLEILTPHLDRNISYRIVRSGGERAEGPSIAIVSFTNKAVRVQQDKILASPMLRDAGYGKNITTNHNLLEFTRVPYWDEEKQKESMRFEEQRGEWNKLEVSHLLIDEASMTGVGKDGAQQIGNKLHKALQEGSQEILMGDINQLPPVGGKSILSYGLNSLPIAELTTIHRQALDSPIIAQAHAILEGRVPEDQVNLETKSQVRLLVPRKKNSEGNVKLNAPTINRWIEKNFPVFIDRELFVPGRDIVLSPVNKQHDKRGNPYVSTSHINAVIATHLAQKEDRHVYEIIAGFNKVYLSVGDRVMVDKIEGTVLGIEKNGKYVGKMPRDKNKALTYFGYVKNGIGGREEEGKEGVEYDYTSLDLDSLIDLGTHNDDDDKEEGRQASHIVRVLLDTEEEVNLGSSGDFGPTVFSLGYAISIHKSQGSEWENVFVVLHDGLPGMLSRELVYTASTRPRQNLFYIAQSHVLKRCVTKARIAGKGLASKVKFFNDGDYLNAGDDFSFDKLRKLGE